MLLTNSQNAVTSLSNDEVQTTWIRKPMTCDGDTIDIWDQNG